VIGSLPDALIDAVLGAGPYQRVTPPARGADESATIRSPRGGEIEFELTRVGGTERFRGRVAHALIDAEPVSGVGDEALFGGLRDRDEAAVLLARDGDACIEIVALAGPHELAPIALAVLAEAKRSP
jgi:hypothetical protein